jgi:hypothetical protein
MTKHILIAAVCLILAGTKSWGSDLTFQPTTDELKLRLPLLADNPFEQGSGSNVDTTRGAKVNSGEKAVVSGERKSVWKAVLYSAAVPGGGEYYLGKKNKARYFFAAEAMTWLGFASFTMYGHWRKDDYVQYAAVHANAQLEGKSDSFADLVGFYSDIDEYNTLGRVQDPERPYLYDTPENHWRWQSSSAQMSYRSIKNSSREAYRRAKFMLGIAAVARLVSIVDAVLDTHRYNSQVESSFSNTEPPVEFRIDPTSQTRQVSLVLHTNW